MLPEQRVEFEVAFAEAQAGTERALFIAKPARSSRGRNIFLFEKLDQLEKQLVENADAPNSGMNESPILFTFFFWLVCSLFCK